MSVSEPIPDPSSAGASIPPSSSPRIEPLRLNELRAELEAREDKVGKAVIADAIGRALLRDPAQEGAAARELLASYNHEPAFRPPLYALVDSFERKRSFKNLGRLYDAEHKSATDAQGRTDALLDRAMFLLATGGPIDEVEALLDQAIEPRPDGARASTWAIIEVLARHRGRDALAREAAKARAEAARSPRLRAVLLHESAVELSSAGEAGGDETALALLIEASVADPTSTRIQTALDGAARAAGRFGVVVDALERRAEAESNDLLAAALYCEASALARARLVMPERALAASEKAVARAPGDVLAWIERAEAAEAADAWDLLDDACAKVLSLTSEGSDLGAFAAVIHHRRAEAASNTARGEDAASHLAAARAAAPRSHALAVMSDGGSPDLLDARARDLEGRANEDGPAEARLEALRELAGIDAAAGRRDALDARVLGFAALAARAASEGGPATAVPGDVWRDLALSSITVGASRGLSALAAHVLADLEGDERASERSAWRLTALHPSFGVTGAARVAMVREALSWR